MIHKVRNALFVAPALAIALITPASAATSVSFVNIPFAFTVGKQQMPAGRYRLEPIAPPSAILIMTNVATRQRVQVLQPAGSEANPRALEFKGGDGYALAKVR